MQKIILDTNVLISALIQSNFPNFILYNHVLENLVELCISDDLMEEYLEVIHRPKFSKYPDFVSKADFLITGNTNDFIMTDFKGTKIVNPKDYWEIFRE